jgi:undecaprenyl diphosphate synthase
MTVILAVSYGGREELTDAVRAIARRVKRDEIAPEDVDQELVASHLGTAGIPDPDLLIRTSGEMRISNFLLWRAGRARTIACCALDWRRRRLRFRCWPG